MPSSNSCKGICRTTEKSFSHESSSDNLQPNFSESDSLERPRALMASKPLESMDLYESTRRNSYNLLEAGHSANENSTAGSPQARAGSNHHAGAADEHLMLFSLICALRYRLLSHLMRKFFAIIPRGARASWTAPVTTSHLVESSSGESSTKISASSTPVTTSVHNGSSTRNKSGGAHGKRGLSGDDEDQDNEDRGNRKRARPNPPNHSTPPKTPKFPCPYHKHDPRIFGANEICSRGWPDIAKLK